MTTKKRMIDILEHNEKIAEALHDCRNRLSQIGVPDVCMTQGYSFRDILSTIEGITPQFTAEQYARVGYYISEEENTQ